MGKKKKMIEAEAPLKGIFSEKSRDYIDALLEACGFSDSEVNLGSINLSLHKIRKYSYIPELVLKTIDDAILNSPDFSAHAITQNFVSLYKERIEQYDRNEIDSTDIDDVIDDIWFQYSSFCTHVLPHSKTQNNVVETHYPGHTMAIECVHGVPYGSIPRLIILYINSIAVKYRTQQVSLGNSIKQFVETLGYTVNYKEGGTNDQVMSQLDKLFNTTFVLKRTQDTTIGDKTVKEIVKVRFNLFDGKVTWEEFTAGMKSNDAALLKLSDEYFKELLAHPVPLSMDALLKLKKSTLAMDLYAFISYRANSNRLVAAKITQLQHQFGNSDETWRFKQALQRAYKKVKEVWPECSAILKNEVLLIPKMPPHIEQK